MNILPPTKSGQDFNYKLNFNYNHWYKCYFPKNIFLKYGFYGSYGDMKEKHKK